MIKFISALIARKTPDSKLERDKDAQAFLRFLSYWWPNWRWILLGFTAIPITVGATLLLPWLVIRIVDDHLMRGQFEGFIELICVSPIPSIFVKLLKLYEEFIFNKLSKVPTLSAINFAFS